MYYASFGISNYYFLIPLVYNFWTQKSNTNLESRSNHKPRILGFLGSKFMQTLTLFNNFNDLGSLPLQEIKEEKKVT